MKNNGIQLSWIVVSNLEEAVKFYSEVIGFTVKTINKNFGWAELVGSSGSILGLTQENSEMHMKAGTNAVITVVVDNIQEGRDELEEKGVHLLGDIMEVLGGSKVAKLFR